MINLPINEGYNIRKFLSEYRAKNNIPVPDEIKRVYNPNESFLEEELSLVTDLRVTRNFIKYLDYFENVESIIITGEESFNNEEVAYIIKKYPKLKELTIEHQTDITFIDVSSLQELQDLNIIDNKYLKNVIGLDKLTDLYKFSLFGSEVYGDQAKEELIRQVYRFIYQHSTECIIDVLYMPDLIKFLDDNNSSLDDIKYNLKWSEILKKGLADGKDKIEYSTGELLMAYNKALSIVRKYIKEEDNTFQKFAILYEWMCENVKYDYSAVNGNTRYVENGIARGRKNGANGTVNALMYHSCVCQGYSKTMQLLLKIAGIHSFDVGCRAEDDSVLPMNFVINGEVTANSDDHSILKVNLDGKIFYSDVTWDACRYQRNEDRKYFLLSKKDISVDHKLSGEDNVIDFGRSATPAEQYELLKFAQDRIRSADLNFKNSQNRMFK